MRVTYDESVDAAYIYLTEIKASEVVNTHPCLIKNIKGEINIDIDKNGIIIGIEVLNASKVLPKNLLDSAERI